MVVLVAGILLASGADAKTPCTPKRLGVGLGGGNLLSGVSVKKCLTKTTAVQGTLGALVNGVGAGADYMIAQTVLWKGRDLRLRWGVGGDGDCVLWLWWLRRSLDRRQRRGGAGSRV